MKVLRIYHAAADPSQRERERRLSALGVDVTLASPDGWLSTDEEWSHGDSPVRAVGLAVARRGDVNRHRYIDEAALALLIARSLQISSTFTKSHSATQRSSGLLQRPNDLPVLTYTAQNIDKRFPPPFAFYERRAHASRGCALSV